MEIIANTTMTNLVDTMGEFVKPVPFAPQNELFIPIGTGIIVGSILMYLWLVYFGLPKFMEKRQPYKLVNLIRTYNIFQVVVCAILVWRSWELGFTHQYLWKCERFYFLTEAQRLELEVGCYLFLLLRAFEFLETIFFILRKKEDQASFLHVYHHISTVVLVWIWLTYDSEPSGVYVTLINSFIHCVMYFYYFLSSFKNKKLKQVLSYIKPCITVMQLVQFFVILSHCVVVSLPSCGFGIFFYLQIVNLSLLTALFGHFFIQTYLMKK